jgi:hypothetical protein
MSDDLIKRDYDLVFPSGYVGTPEQLRNALTEMWRRENGKGKSLLIHAAIFSLAETQAKLAKAVEALRPFADVLKGNYSHQPDTMPISMGFGEYDRRLALKLMDFRNARAVLAELEKTK